MSDIVFQPICMRRFMLASAPLAMSVPRMAKNWAMRLTPHSDDCSPRFPGSRPSGTPTPAAFRGFSLGPRHGRYTSASRALHSTGSEAPFSRCWGARWSAPRCISGASAARARRALSQLCARQAHFLDPSRYALLNGESGRQVLQPWPHRDGHGREGGRCQAGARPARVLSHLPVWCAARPACCTQWRICRKPPIYLCSEAIGKRVLSCKRVRGSGSSRESMGRGETRRNLARPAKSGKTCPRRERIAGAERESRERIAGARNRQQLEQSLQLT